MIPGSITRDPTVQPAARARFLDTLSGHISVAKAVPPVLGWLHTSKVFAYTRIGRVLYCTRYSAASGPNGGLPPMSHARRE